MVWPGHRLAKSHPEGIDRTTYTEELDVVEDVVVVGEVIAGDNIDAGVFLDLPVLCAKAFAFSQEVFLRKLSGPVGFGRFLQVTIDSHPRETED